MPRVAAAKDYVFTYNNPPINERQFLLKFKEWAPIEYLTFQHETGENGTPHFQGFVIFATKKRFTWLKARDTHIHWEKRRGSREQARDYAQKEDTRTVHHSNVEDGSFPESNQGRRTDLEAATALITEGKGMLAVALQLPVVYVKYNRGLHALMIKLLEDRVKVPPKVILLYGPPDCGKSRYIYDKYDISTIWSLPAGRDIWYDGYSGQKIALFDEFCGRASRISLVQVLRVWDRYPIRVPFKGGFIPFLPEKIYITTNIHPVHWFDYSTRSAQYRALTRRFFKIFWFKQLGLEPAILYPASNSTAVSKFLKGPPDYVPLPDNRLGVVVVNSNQFDF